MSQRQRYGWGLLLGTAALAGLVLRLLHPEDMEWKEDEQYNFFRTTQIGISEPWPWTGMNSGVYLANPGMSIWIFVALARLARATDPLQLVTALKVVSFLGIFLLLWIALREVKTNLERQAWLWAFALAMVNPILILYTRKLWPEPFFTLFTPLMFIAWFRSRSFAGAFFYGVLGAILGQIHLSGFFLAFALFAWTLWLRSRQVRWLAWVLGSVAGALPLLPWLLAVLKTPIQEPIARGLGEMGQLKYWVFWSTNPTGLHLGNALGLLRGNSTWAQLSDFVRYPLFGSGQATNLGLVAHLVAAGAGGILIAFALRASTRLFRPSFLRDQGICTPSEFLISSALIPCGLIMTATGVMIRRYYLTVAFPLEYLWITLGLLSVLGASPPAERQSMTRAAQKWVLPLLFLAQLSMSALLVHYVHVNQGATQGDYGDAFYKLPFGPMKDFRNP